MSKIFLSINDQVQRTIDSKHTTSSQKRDVASGKLDIALNEEREKLAIEAQPLQRVGQFFASLVGRSQTERHQHPASEDLQKLLDKSHANLTKTLWRSFSKGSTKSSDRTDPDDPAPKNLGQ